MICFLHEEKLPLFKMRAALLNILNILEKKKEIRELGCRPHRLSPT